MQAFYELFLLIFYEQYGVLINYLIILYNYNRPLLDKFLFYTQGNAILTHYHIHSSNCIVPILHHDFHYFPNNRAPPEPSRTLKNPCPQLPVSLGRLE